LQSLMSALQITDPMQFSGSFLQAFVGSSQMIVMSVASVLLSIMIALIPFIAGRIVRGDIGSTLMTVISGAMTAGAVASGLAFAGGGGLAAGRQATSGGAPSPPAGGAGSLSQGNSPIPQGTGGGAVTGDSRSPSPIADGVAGGAVSRVAGSSETPNPQGLRSTSQDGSESSSVNARPASYSGRSLAGLAAWQAGHAIGRTMRWAGMGAK
jgi:hypothetical protein